MSAREPVGGGEPLVTSCEAAPGGEGVVEGVFSADEMRGARRKELVRPSTGSNEHLAHRRPRRPALARSLQEELARGALAWLERYVHGFYG